MEQIEKKDVTAGHVSSRKRPVPVTILAWLFIVSGVVSGFGTTGLLLFGFTANARHLLMLAVLQLIGAILSIVIAVGLFKMRRWSVILLGVTIVLGILAFVVAIGSPIGTDRRLLVNLIIELIIFGYLIAIRRKFS